MAEKRKRKFRLGKAILWGSGLAAIPGIAKTVSSPMKELASNTSEGLRARTPRLTEAKAAWNREFAEDPHDLFLAYAQKFGLDEGRIAAMDRLYFLLFLLSGLAVVGGLVLLCWNLSGLFLAVLGVYASAGCLYRRDALHFRKLVPFRIWLQERLWWIFG